MSHGLHSASRQGTPGGKTLPGVCISRTSERDVTDKGKSGQFPDYKTLPVADLIPYARNSRTHSDAQVAKIAASIREFGFLNPIIVDGSNGIVAGHGRVLAAQKLGLTTLPVIEASHLTEAQKRAYVIADNRLALDAGWDLDMLRVELTDLKGMDFDLSLTGFEIGEIGKLMLDPAGGLTDPDDVPEPPAQPVTVEGDVWLLGAYFECAECRKHFSYAEGMPFKDEGCPCGKA